MLNVNKTASKIISKLTGDNDFDLIGCCYDKERDCFLISLSLGGGIYVIEINKFGIQTGSLVCCDYTKKEEVCEEGYNSLLDALTSS